MREQRAVVDGSPNHRKILVIEDDRAIRKMVVYILEQAGYEVTAESDGRTGLDRLRKNGADLVLLDVDLRSSPNEMDGIDVLKELRADPDVSDATVVAFTGFAMVGDRKRFLAQGFDAYIPKPIEPEPFIDEVARLLERPS